MAGPSFGGARGPIAKSSLGPPTKKYDLAEYSRRDTKNVVKYF